MIYKPSQLDKFVCNNLCKTIQLMKKINLCSLNWIKVIAKFLNKRYQIWTTYKSNHINMQWIMIAKVVDNKLQTDIQKSWNKGLIYWKRKMLQDINFHLSLNHKSIVWFSPQWSWFITKNWQVFKDFPQGKTSLWELSKQFTKIWG